MLVDIFIPCFIDQLYPQVGFSMVKVLEQLGCTINYNPNQTCCGQPAFNNGLWKEAADVAKKFTTDFNDAHLIVVPSASCVGFVRNNFSKIFTDKDNVDKAESLRGKIFEFTEFLVKHTDASQLKPTFEAKATYHDSCSALRECNIKTQPHHLLKLVKGLEMTPLNDGETCCGFGGTFSVKYEPIATAMLTHKLAAVEKSGADYIISTDVSCLMHLETYIKKQGFTFKTMHIAEVLAAGY